MPGFLLILAVLILPVAFMVGGHNGATILGCLSVILACGFTIASSPTKGTKP